MLETDYTSYAWINEHPKQWKLSAICINEENSTLTHKIIKTILKFYHSEQLFCAIALKNGYCKD